MDHPRLGHPGHAPARTTARRQYSASSKYRKYPSSIGPIWDTMLARIRIQAKLAHSISASSGSMPMATSRRRNARVTGPELTARMNSLAGEAKRNAVLTCGVPSSCSIRGAKNPISGARGPPSEWWQMKPGRSRPSELSRR
jgi:hypothetical protein